MSTSLSYNVIWIPSITPAYYSSNRISYFRGGPLESVGGAMVIFEKNKMSSIFEEKKYFGFHPHRKIYSDSYDYGKKMVRFSMHTFIPSLHRFGPFLSILWFSSGGEPP